MQSGLNTTLYTISAMRRVFMKELVSISEMAKLHNISRQTLIHYDKIGLFKPIHTDSNGYRYYSHRQVPFLREICFLKELGISLLDIKQHFKEREPRKASELLNERKKILDNEIYKLNKIRTHINQRINIYDSYEDVVKHIEVPFLQKLVKREGVFVEFGKAPKKADLHLATMKAWRYLAQYEMLVSNGFGTIIRQESLDKEDIMEGAGVYVLLPYPESDMENIKIMPAGEYLCMYKYGMPYDLEHLKYLLDVAKQNGYKICGDIFDVCLLDTTFYKDMNDKDFCMIQIPISR